ncbi:hypothetical protein EH165_07725 [Nakamurella antarctica]|uniref:Uncharacterized protein n=1 Tax=Nakamurella antarctica TaxID=1902245 RepID=A0A3G8ZLM1_9ACTN|nr:hypothetical protein [Nakamurella antarctica]AZI58048.1 hypothetical protein EH165_07725 [Nakamurella antarctica]
MVIALIAGVGVWFFAFRETKPAGQASPQAAAAALFADVSNGDLVGLADTFDPVESSLVTDFAGDVTKHLQRIGLLTDEATINNSTGVGISIKGVTYDESAAENPLPNLSIVKVTGGTVTIDPPAGNNSAAQTDKFRALLAALEKANLSSDFQPAVQTEPTVIDIAKVIREENNGKPLRISTVQRDGEWYPSLFYTLADYAAQQAGKTLTPADSIPAVGAASPGAAMDTLIKASLADDPESVIKILDPREMGVVHDYGRMLVDGIGRTDVPQAQVTASWTLDEVTGGTKVSLGTLEITFDGTTAKIVRDVAAGSVTVSANGEAQTFDSTAVASLLGSKDLSEIHPNLPAMVARMIKAALGLGVIATKVDGSWYIAPARTFLGTVPQLMSGMEESDIDMFLDLLKQN